MDQNPEITLKGLKLQPCTTTYCMLTFSRSDQRQRLSEYEFFSSDNIKPTPENFHHCLKACSIMSNILYCHRKTSSRNLCQFQINKLLSHSQVAVTIGLDAYRLFMLKDKLRYMIISSHPSPEPCTLNYALNTNLQLNTERTPPSFHMYTHTSLSVLLRENIDSFS